MSVTISDVAKYANASVGSVSRYLNGYILKPSTASHIREAIEKLGYKTNYIAKGLKTNKTMTVGVLINSLTDPFSTSIISAAESVFTQYNYNMFLCNYDNDFLKQEERLAYLLEKHVDGVLVYPLGPKLPLLQRCIDMNIPAVIVNEDVEDTCIDKVLIDNEEAAYNATKYLIESGHRRIGLIAGCIDKYTGLQRLEGYKRALRENCINIDESLIKLCNFQAKMAYAATKDFMKSKNPPTALFAQNYHMTQGMILALNEMNIDIPVELSVMGFDRFELSDVIKPSLTLMEQPNLQIGRQAAEILLKRLSGDYTDFPEKVMLHSHLLIRKSVKNSKEK